MDRLLTIAVLGYGQYPAGGRWKKVHVRSTKEKIRHLVLGLKTKMRSQCCQSCWLCWLLQSCYNAMVSGFLIFDFWIVVNFTEYFPPKWSPAKLFSLLIVIVRSGLRPRCCCYLVDYCDAMEGWILVENTLGAAIAFIVAISLVVKRDLVSRSHILLWSLRSKWPAMSPSRKNVRHVVNDEEIIFFDSRTPSGTQGQRHSFVRQRGWPADEITRDSGEKSEKTSKSPNDDSSPLWKIDCFPWTGYWP